MPVSIMRALKVTRSDGRAEPRVGEGRLTHLGVVGRTAQHIDSNLGIVGAAFTQWSQINCIHRGATFLTLALDVGVEDVEQRPADGILPALRLDHVGVRSWGPSRSWLQGGPAAASHCLPARRVQIRQRLNGGLPGGWLGAALCLCAEGKEVTGDGVQSGPEGRVQWWGGRHTVPVRRILAWSTYPERSRPTTEP